VQPEEANQSWSLDFISDSLSSGRAFRTSNIIDDFNREILWIEIDTSSPAERVIRTVEMIATWRGYPKQNPKDNSPKLISQKLTQWAEVHVTDLAFILPDKPSQNAYVERFNRTFRDDVLDDYLFSSLQEARDITEERIEEFNAIRTQDALENLTLYQYATENA